MSAAPSASASALTDSTAIIDYGRTRAGTRQLRRQWKSVGPARAVVVLVHGISEHSGRYEHVGARFSAAGFHTVAFDQRGHGQSEGVRTYIDSFDSFVDDVEDHLEIARRQDLPVVLVGHSMGGLVCTAYAVSDRPQPDLLVLSGPALGANVPTWQRVLAPKIAQLAPKFFLPANLDSSVLSRDPAVQQSYKDDPLIKSGATAKIGAELFATMESVGAALDEIRVPTLCLHGADDELVPASVSRPLDGLPGVERRELPGLRHEIFNEPEGPEVLDDVVTWINERLGER